jgi:hypothetical protein
MKYGREAGSGQWPGQAQAPSAGMEDHAGARRRCGCEGPSQDGWAGQFIQQLFDWVVRARGAFAPAPRVPGGCRYRGDPKAGSFRTQVPRVDTHVPID